MINKEQILAALKKLGPSSPTAIANMPARCRASMRMVPSAGLPAAMRASVGSRP